MNSPAGLYGGGAGVQRAPITTAPRKRASLYRRRLQAGLERLAAAAGLLVCSPLLLLAAVCILFESGWPVFFRQLRVGRGGTTFRLLKLRSMRTDLSGARITASGDPRVTRIGVLLRRYKLDELPQLWNILTGHMQFIGPRPELPSLVDTCDPLWAAVLRDKPGLTDLSTLIYRNEEEILAGFPDSDRAYREVILPRKLSLSACYFERRNLYSDLRLLLLTAKYSFFPAGFDPDRIERLFLETDRPAAAASPR